MRKVDEAAEMANSTVETYKGDFNFAFKVGVSFANSKDNERILMPALKFEYLRGDIEITIVYRHKTAQVGDQGFLTSKGRFVDPKEAAKIALDMGQINEPVDSLTSELLY